MSRATFGVIGLGTMGRNLALNIESHGVPVAVWNREKEWIDAIPRGARRDARSPATSTLEELVAALERPRRILMMIPAGKPVDEMIEQLAPLLDAGDILIDGGNSWFEDTRRRERACARRAFILSAAACRAERKGRGSGPSMMPGGSPEAVVRIARTCSRQWPRRPRPARA